MSGAPLSPADRALLLTPRHGESIVRLAGDMGGGDASPFNYGLWCGSCDMLLGRLGIFRLREPSEWGVPYEHRIAHCARCHATTFVREHAGRAEVARLARASLTEGVCWLCPTPTRVAEVEMAGEEKADLVGTVDGATLVRKNLGGT